MKLCVIGGDYLGQRLSEYLVRQCEHYCEEIIYLDDSPPTTPTAPDQAMAHGVKVIKNKKEWCNTLQKIKVTFIIPPITETLDEWTEQALKCCQESSVEDVVLWSWIGCEQAAKWTCHLLDKFWIAEKHAKRMFPNCCIVRAGFLNQWFRRWAEDVIKTQTFRFPMPITASSFMFSPLDYRDVLHCCVELINYREGGIYAKHQYKVYELTGPRGVEGLKFTQFFAHNCYLIVDYQCVEEKTCLEFLVGTRVGEMGVTTLPQAQLMMEFCRLANQGVLGFISRHLEYLCGGEGLFLEDTLLEYKEEFIKF